MRSIGVKDPRGVVWHLSVAHEIVTTDALRAAMAKAGIPIPRERFFFPHYEFGVSIVGHRGLTAPWSTWGREHSWASIMVAETRGPPPERRAWISPSHTRRALKRDLEQLAAAIRLGEEPRPFGHSQ